MVKQKCAGVDKMKVGDIIIDQWYGMGVVTELHYDGAEATIFFTDSQKKLWFDEEMLATVELVK